MTRPMMTGGGDQLRAMRQKAKAEPPKPVPAKPIVAAKAPTKSKKSKTRADYEAKVAERRKDAWASIFLFSGNANRPCEEELLRNSSTAISSYMDSSKSLVRDWNADGTRKMIESTGHRGIYRVRAVPANPGFLGQVFHYQKTQKGDKFVYLPVVDYEIPPHVTPDEALQAATELAGIHGLKLLRQWKVWYEGEREYDFDIKGLANCRQFAVEAIHGLVTARGNPEATNAELDVLMAECGRTLCRYSSRVHLIQSWWDADGKWFGPKKPVPSGKKATKAPSHYLANFQKAIERGDLTQADSRILHALRNDFPRPVLEEYEATALPFRDKLSNFGPLRAKLDLIPSGQS